MGHSDSSFTLCEYGHLFQAFSAKVTEQVDGLVQATEASPPSLGSSTYPRPARPSR